MLLINRLAKITDNSIHQSATPDVFIGVSRHEDCRNRVSSFDEVSVEFDSGHRRHMDVSDQAGGFDEMTGFEEIRWRRERLDAVAQRPDEPSHRLAKELIVLNDRDQ